MMLQNRDNNRAVARAEKYKTFLKAKYSKLNQQLVELEFRRNILEEQMIKLKVPDNEKEKYRDAFYKAEADAHSDTKKKVSIEDFDSLAIIGRGAFGEVRLVRMKDRFSREIYGRNFYQNKIWAFNLLISIIPQYSYEIHDQRFHDTEKPSGAYPSGAWYSHWIRKPLDCYYVL